MTLGTFNCISKRSANYRRRYPPTAPLTRLTDAETNGTEALRRDLAQALHLWPWEIDLGCSRWRQSAAHSLASCLRAQRRAASAGQWSYDIACHSRLLELSRRLRALD